MPSRSRRLDVIPPYLFGEIARVKREAVAKGADIIDLGIGDPDLPTPKEVIDALCTAVQNPAAERSVHLKLPESARPSCAAGHRRS